MILFSTRNLTQIIVLSSITLCCLMIGSFVKKESYQNEKQKYDYVFSILVHENVEFLLKQLENIKDNVDGDYAIILNCNDHMFEECSKIKMPDNVYIHDVPINKKYQTGDLLRGIYNNMYYALERFTFDYFITLSSRNMFGNRMTLSDLQNLDPHVEDARPWSEKQTYWGWWPKLEKSLLVNYYLSQGREVANCAHEGAVFTENGCKFIAQFLETHPDIKNDSFDFDAPMEEFVMVTIATNSGEPVYYIGNGCCNEDHIPPNDPNGKNKKFVFKIKRDMGSLNNMNNIQHINHEKSLV